MADPLRLPSDLDPAQQRGPETDARLPSDMDEPRDRSLAEQAVQPFIGFNRALKGILAAPGNATGWALSKATGNDSYRGAGDRVVGAGMMGADPDAGGWKQPKDLTDKVLQGVGEGVGAAIVPEAAVGALTRAGAATVFPRAMEAMSKMFGSGASVGSAATNATIGAGGGAGGEIGEDLLGAPGRIVGGLAGGFGTAGAMAAGKGAAKGLVEAARPAFESADTQAAKRLVERSGVNRSALLDELETSPGQIVPESRPTTGQLTGNMGILAEEKLVGTQRPADFSARQAEQNQARVAALDAVQPDGNAASVPRALQAAHQAIDDAAEQTVAQATKQARAAASRLPRGGDAADVGETIRGYLKDALQDAKEATQKLWSAVDPGGQLTVDVRPFQTAIRDIYGNLTEEAWRGVGPAERGLKDLIDGYGAVRPLKNFTDLRSLINDAMMTERAANNGVATTAYRRLVQLRQAADSAMNASVEGQLAAEQAAVRRGSMDPAETLGARIQRMVDDWRAQRDNASRADLAESGAGDAASRTSSPAAVPGAKGSQGTGSGAPSGTAGVQGATFDAAARERLKAATNATRQQHETFDRGSVGQILATRGTATDFRLADSAVPGRVWRPGGAGQETAEAFLSASGGKGEARAALHDAAMTSLQDPRRGITLPDGTVDGKKLAAWRKAHASALKAVPELDKELTTVQRAAEAVASANANRLAASKEFQLGAVGKVMQLEEPADVVNAVGRIFTGAAPVKTMSKLAEAVGGQPGGADGLKRAIAEHMRGLLVGNTEAATTGVGQIKSDTFQAFVRKNAATLKAAGYTDEQVGSLQAIAADLQRANRSVAAVRTGGGSDTSSKIGPALAKALNSPTSMLAEVVAGYLAGSHFAGTMGGLAGAGTGVARHVFMAARRAGLEKAEDLFAQALLDPDVARRLLKKLPDQPTRAESIKFGESMYRVLAQANTRELSAQ